MHHLDTDSQTALGPLLGLRRPRYEILHDTLAPFLSSQPSDGDLFLFVNVTNALRQLFSEYAVARLTRGELNRHPRLLAAELLNLAGHYRNYAWKHFERRTTVLLYHSTRPCPAKQTVLPGYKAALYAKRLDQAPGEFEAVRRYVAFNLTVARQLAEFIPHVHVVDTGETDPEAWPWALLEEGRVAGPMLVLSSWTTDLQYTLASPGGLGSGFGGAVLRAAGDHTRVVTRDGLLEELLRKSKTCDELVARLAPEHFPYLLALAGDDDLGVPGIPKVGMAKAAKMVADRVAKGLLPADAPGLPQLLEDGRLTEEHHATIQAAWETLVHSYYTARIPPAAMSALDATLVNRSGLGELEAANARFFAGAINLDMLFAGENY